MSQENTEIVRLILAEWERGDFRATVKLLDLSCLSHSACTCDRTFRLSRRRYAMSFASWAIVVPSYSRSQDS
jgi:hypothetical protein